MRCRERKNAGSAVILVVCMLVLLAMIGSVFILVAFTDRKDAGSVATASPMKQVAMDVTRQIQAIVLDDLRLTAQGVYGSATSYSQTIDAPSEDVDPWLASTAPYQNGNTGMWRHITHMPGLTGGSVYKVAVNDGDANNPLVDTDGDGIPDARLYESLAKDKEGNGAKYFVAVRVIDLGSLANINTAWGLRADNPMSPRPVCAVDLKNNAVLVTSAVTWYDMLAGWRWGMVQAPGWDDNANSAIFNNGLATRVPDPLLGWTPFTMGDELALRWLAPAQLDGQGVLRTTPYENARVMFVFTAADGSGNIPQANIPIFERYRPYLTTHNVDRLLVRDLTNVGGMWPLLANLGNNDGGKAYIQGIYDQLLKMRATTAPGTNFLFGQDVGAFKKAAAHFAVNLYLYQQAIANPMPSTVVSFQPTDKATGNPETFKVYGLQEQPVFTEAFVKLSETNQFHGIEIYNPFNVTIDLTQYRLNLNGTASYTFPAATTLAPGIRKVYYTLAAADNNFIQPNAQWIKIDNINLAGNNWVSLERIVSATEYAPIDRIRGDNLGGPTAPGVGTGLVITKDARRDDDATRMRVLVADYLVSAADKNYFLVAKGVAEGTISKALYAAPLSLAHKPVKDLGEITRVYLTGPEIADTSSPSNPGTTRGFPEAILDFGDGIARGRLDLRPGVVDQVGWNLNSVNYGNIPWAAFVSDFFAMLTGDPNPANAGKIYGRININTATPWTMKVLPWTAIGGMNMADADKVNLVSAIAAYRDKEVVQLPATPNQLAAINMNYNTRETRTEPGVALAPIPGLRKGVTADGNNSDFEGFLSTGELAIPCTDYFYGRLSAGQQSNLGKSKDDQWSRDDFYRQASNLLTVRSDVFCVYVRVQIGNSANPQVKRNYVAVIDRSNCKKPGDQPSVLMFTEIK